VRWGIPGRSPRPTSPSHRCTMGPSLSPLKGGEGFFSAGANRVSLINEARRRSQLIFAILCRKPPAVGNRLALTIKT